MNTITTKEIKSGYKQTPIGIMPEDWEVKKINDVATIQNGRSYSHLKKGNIPVYASGGVINYVDKFIYEGVSVGIGRKGTIDKPQLLNGKYWVVDTLFYLNDFKDVIPYFLYSKFNLITWYKYNESSGVPSLIKNTIKKIPLAVPPLPEQEQIASCLTTWDKGIEKLSALIESKKQQKKGVMQGLFNGQMTVDTSTSLSTGNGQLIQAKEGEDFTEDWEEVRLGNLTKYYDGTHQTPNYVEQGIPFYSVEQVTSNNFKDTKFISEEVFEKECKRMKLEKDDILMTRIGDVGTSKLISWDVTASIYVSLALIKQCSKLNSKFLEEFIRSDFFQRGLYKKTIHTAFPKKINLGEIGNLIIKFPSLKEQTAIGEIFSVADKEITILEQKLEAMQSQKKGLMQVLLTGQKRLV